MPYNTRRKSLSLPSLGIHVPVSHSSRAVTGRGLVNHADLPAHHGDNDGCHPNKKIKRSHCYSQIDTNEYDAATFDRTPPPSPRRAGDCEKPPAEIKIEGINDDIVESVLMQLQSTGNRPHLVKELSAVLIQQLRIVQQSANPCAIISSRLSAYMKRPCWTSSSPCPIAKELETVHPRRTYFYLTTSTPQPFPDLSGIQIAPQRSILSPPSSSTPASTAGETDRRRELSPSPELDLPPPEFDMISHLAASHSVGSLSKKPQRAPPRTTRGPSPPLEKDEKEFTQTADGLQKRKLTGHLLSAEPIVHSIDLDDSVREESLFGEPRYLVPPPSNSQFAIMTSPAMRPNAVASVKKEVDTDAWAELDELVEWDRSPENVELDELDGLLDDY